MFNLGLSEIVVIAIVLIIVVGPEKLPMVMKNVGKALRTVRSASREIQSTVGLDELWREDVLQTPPPPREPPASTVSRQAALGPSAAAASSTATEPAKPAAEPAPAAPAAAAPTAPASDATPSAPAASAAHGSPTPGDVKGDG
jgi:sec-independent protein translocase protein TatB